MIGQRSLPVLLLSDWYALLDVVLVLAAGVLWYVMPELGAWPLVLALAPWPLRIAVGRLPVRRTALDVFFLLFLVTALVGVWAAYDQERALAKFWLILDGVLLFYALAAQPRGNHVRLAWGLGGLAVVLSVYYFFTHDWVETPSKVEALNRIGLAWMNIRPTLASHILHPNVVAGIAAPLLPFFIALILLSGRRGRPLETAGALLGLILVVFLLLMSTSRGTWIAVTAALVLWGCWGLSGSIARFGTITRGSAFLTLSGLLVISAVFVIFLTPGGLLGLVEQLPGPAQAGNRLELVRASSYLIADFPLTGSGLDSFPGLYSQYILVLPFYIVEHGHNLFLDITLEQGFFGLLAALGIIGITGWQLARAIHTDVNDDNPLLAAALTGLIILILHGLVDDTLYGSRAQFLLWVLPGVGQAVLTRTAQPIGIREVDPARRTRLLATGSVVLVVVVVYLFMFREAIGVVWRANVGAVQMAQIQLADFPTGVWDDGAGAGALTPAAAAFESVIRDNPGNQTARYRLGLIALLTRNFPVAVEHLEAAFASAPGHPGIRKSLAFAYVWNGQLDLAMTLIAEVPDADTELRNYTGWWSNHGRPDLAELASQMEAMLGPR